MTLTKTLAAAVLASFALAIPTAYADDTGDPNRFVKMYDGNKDGMVSKAEAMKMVEKMFEKADTKKKGMLDTKQFELFLKMLMMDHGG